MSNEELVPLDLETLRETAGNATAGPWEFRELMATNGGAVLARGTDGQLLPVVSRGIYPPDADYIATFDPPTTLALLDRIARLTESSRKLANQIVGYGDRVQESVRSIQADAWDMGVKTTNDYLFGPEAPEPTNPYRTEPTTTNH